MNLCKLSVLLNGGREALGGLSQGAPWRVRETGQVRETRHADMAGGSQGGTEESHSRHADRTPTWKVLLGDGRREERESRQGLKDEEEKEKREERERGGVSYLMAGEKKGERGEGFSLKEDFM